MLDPWTLGAAGFALNAGIPVALGWERLKGKPPRRTRVALEALTACGWLAIAAALTRLFAGPGGRPVWLLSILAAQAVVGAVAIGGLGFLAGALASMLLRGRAPSLTAALGWLHELAAALALAGLHVGALNAYAASRWAAAPATAGRGSAAASGGLHGRQLVDRAGDGAA
jgi:hypothetical protein